MLDYMILGRATEPYDAAGKGRADLGTGIVRRRAKHVYIYIYIHMYISLYR